MPRLHVIAATVLALLAVGAVPAHAAEPSGRGTRAPMTLTWSDGSTSTTRTFTSSDYQHSPANLPTLRIHVPPADGGLVYLQVAQDGEWGSEWLTKTDARGNAVLAADPTCIDGSWCDGTYRYRIKRGRTITYLTVSYWDR